MCSEACVSALEARLIEATVAASCTAAVISVSGSAAGDCVMPAALTARLASCPFPPSQSPTPLS